MSFIYINTSSITTKNDFRQTTLAAPRELPIPILNRTDQEPFINKAEMILDLKKRNKSANTTSLEKEIDEMVYKLYGLTEEEIRIVEGEK